MSQKTVKYNSDFVQGSICPYCGSRDVEDIIDYLAEQKGIPLDIFICLDCNKTWDSVQPPALEVEGDRAHQDSALLACTAVEDFASRICQCPFCDAYAGFKVEDNVLDRDGETMGHDSNCPWPLVKLALDTFRSQQNGE